MVTLTDKRVERIIKALRARVNYKNEDWLIVVATDHGGDNSHGGSSYKEQNAFIILNDHHPNKSDLLIYAKGNDGTGAVYAGSFGLPALTIKTNNGFAATWGSIAAPGFVKKTTDLKGAPHLYSVVPTILKFLGIAIPAAYDGQSLINF